MNISFLKRFNKKPTPLYYLVLILRNEKAHAIVFEELEGRVEIIGQKEQYFSTIIDNVSFEEFLDVMDKAISGAESALPKDIQTQKTIFGVQESWTEQDQIKKDRLLKLKKAGEELGLVPIGFLVISQAVSHLLQKEEGVPLSAILVEINKKSINVTLFRAGKNIESKSSEIHDSVPFTVDTLLKHFDIPEILPPRIVIFNGKEDFSQEFISHSWSKSLPFLHLPQIINLPYGFDAKSVLFGATTQLGLELPEKDMPKEQNVQGEIPEYLRVPDEHAPETLEYDKNFNEVDFGFTKDADVALKKPNVISFTKREDVVPRVTIEKNQTKIKSQNIFQNIVVSAKNVLPKFSNFAFAFAKKINIENLMRFPSGKLNLNIIIPALLLFLTVVVVSYFLFLKVTITINVNPKISEQTKEIIFSTTEKTDMESATIKGQFISISEDGSVSIATTGKKDVGTFAKGTVTLFSRLTEDTTLDKGTVTTSSNGLKFTLNDSISIASTSADASGDPLTMNANVTAEQLGKESNLPSGTKFSIKSFDTSDLMAKNDDPFSGGTKSQITVVSENDITKVKENLIKQLEAKAKENLQKQLDQNKVLLPSFTSEEISKQSLSAKTGDKAEQLTLNGTVKYQGIFYDKNDLVVFSKYFLSKDVSSNQEIDYNNIKITVLDIKNVNDNETHAKINIKALLLPKIDKNQTAKNLKGKNFEFAKSYIGKFPQVASVEIQLSPNIPFLPNNLPSREKNIEVLIKINN